MPHSPATVPHEPPPTWPPQWPPPGLWHAWRRAAWSSAAAGREAAQLRSRPLACCSPVPASSGVPGMARHQLAAWRPAPASRPLAMTPIEHDHLRRSAASPDRPPHDPASQTQIPCVAACLGSRVSTPHVHLGLVARGHHNIGAVCRGAGKPEVGGWWLGVPGVSVSRPAARPQRAGGVIVRTPDRNSPEKSASVLAASPGATTSTRTMVPDAGHHLLASCLNWRVG